MDRNIVEFSGELHRFSCRDTGGPNSTLTCEKYSFDRSTCGFARTAACETVIAGSNSIIQACQVITEARSQLRYPCVLLSYQTSVVKCALYVVLSDKLIKWGSFVFDKSVSRSDLVLADGPVVLLPSTRGLMINHRNFKARMQDVPLGQYIPACSKLSIVDAVCSMDTLLVLISYVDEVQGQGDAIQKIYDLYAVTVCDKEVWVKQLPLKNCIPAIYFPVITYIDIEYLYLEDNTLKSKLHMTTSANQIVSFSDGKLVGCVEAQINAKLDHLARFQASKNQLHWAVMGSDMECTILRFNHEVVEKIPSVTAHFIGDFLRNGGEQIILLTSDECDSPDRWQDCILTDGATCRITLGPSASGSQISRQAAENTHAAFKALSGRLQNLKDHLTILKREHAVKEGMIAETTRATQIISAGGNPSRQVSLLQDDLVDLFESEARTARVESMADFQPALQISDTWLRRHQHQLIVGVAIKNTSNRSLHGVQLIVQDSAPSSSHVVLRSRSQLLRLKQQYEDAVPAKRSRLDGTLRMEDVFIETRLEPGCSAYVTTVVPCPVFATRTTYSYDLCLTWCGDDEPTESDGSHGTTHTLNLQPVTIQLHDLLSHAFDLPYSRPVENTDVSHLFDLLTLVSLGELNELCISSQMSRVTDLRNVLSDLSMTFNPQWHCWMDSRSHADLPTVAVITQRTKMAILKVLSRDNGQVMTLVQSLYSTLPCDVTITQHHHGDGNASQSQLLSCMQKELGLLHNALTRGRDEGTSCNIDVTSNVSDVREQFQTIKKKISNVRIQDYSLDSYRLYTKHSRFLSYTDRAALRLLVQTTKDTK